MKRALVDLIDARRRQIHRIGRMPADEAIATALGKLDVAETLGLATEPGRHALVQAAAYLISAVEARDQVNGEEADFGMTKFYRHGR